MDDLIKRKDAIDALWKALYEYEDKTEKQFQDSDELNLGDWLLHRIFVQNMSDIDRQTILQLPSAEPEWISVTERLPNVNEEVLVYLWGNSPYIANIDADGRWETNDFYIDKDDIPEFWMPLPEQKDGE